MIVKLLLLPPLVGLLVCAVLLAYTIFTDQDWPIEVALFIMACIAVWGLSAAVIGLILS